MNIRLKPEVDLSFKHLTIKYKQCHHQLTNTLLPSLHRRIWRSAKTRRLIKQFTLSRCQPVINNFNIQLMTFFVQFNGTFNTIANISERLPMSTQNSVLVCATQIFTLSHDDSARWSHKTLRVDVLYIFIQSSFHRRKNDS